MNYSAGFQVLASLFVRNCMSSPFGLCSQRVRQLLPALQQLAKVAHPLDLPTLAGQDWYELLVRKLIPQLGDDSFLVVAVVGGTNIGKSVIFNHLAGFRASATSPLASGTKHATVLLPPGFARQHTLRDIFPGFDLQSWDNAEQALAEDDRHLLFWRERDVEAHEDQQLPDNLLILDTPDVDSVARVNWERADHIRQTADVLVAVLTQQKYNDAAVKEFFRKAAIENKLVLLVFNQCLLPEDEEYWPIWVETFCSETGIRPAALFIAPSDRRAAEANALPFYERPWPLPAGYTPPAEDQPHDLMRELSDLRFGEIKLQTLLGSLKQLTDSDVGIPEWLNQIRERASEFSDAAEILSTNRLARIERWPNVPNRALIEQIRLWWGQQREGWAANVHGFYNRLGQFVSKPFQMLRDHTQGPATPPLEAYRNQEWQTILDAVEGVFDKLTWMRDLGNPLLVPRLDRILSGTARGEFITALHEQHNQLDFPDEIQSLVSRELATFRQDSPDYYKFFRRLDSFAAATRPAVSVVLFLTGAGPVGDMLMPAVTDTALQGVLHVAGDAVGGTVLTTVGDKVLSEGAATSTGYLEARFRQLHTAFAQQRAHWLTTQLTTVLGELPVELAAAARIPDSPEFTAVAEQTAALDALIAKLTQA